MSVDDCINYTYSLMSFDPRMLICRIGEAFSKHSAGKTLTLEDRFILGLRYSEFLATGDSDLDYVQAEQKRQACLAKLNLSTEYIRQQCISLLGLY